MKHTKKRLNRCSRVGRRQLFLQKNSYLIHSLFSTLTLIHVWITWLFIWYSRKKVKYSTNDWLHKIRVLKTRRRLNWHLRFIMSHLISKSPLIPLWRVHSFKTGEWTCPPLNVHHRTALPPLVKHKRWPQHFFLVTIVQCTEISPYILNILLLFIFLSHSHEDMT